MYKLQVDADIEDTDDEVEVQRRWAIVYRDLCGFSAMRARSSADAVETAELWLPGQKMDIAHMDGHYWRLVACPGRFVSLGTSPFLSADV